jgi:hypothetical protein
MPKDREPITEHSASARPRIRAWQPARERETYTLARGEIDHAVFFIREEPIGDERHVPSDLMERAAAARQRRGVARERPSGKARNRREARPRAARSTQNLGI